MTRVAREVHLDIEIPEGGAPLRQRISDALMQKIRTGQLSPGDALPPTRSLASILGVARGAVVEAYDELSASGFVIAVAGSGTRVAPGATDVARSTPAGLGSEPTGHPFEDASGGDEILDLVADLRVGRPDPGLISKADWRKSWREAAFVVPPLTVGWVPDLRIALSTHLRRTRGLVFEPDEVFVVPGALSAIRTLSFAAKLSGRSVVVEDPGYDGTRNILEAANARVRGLQVDRGGLDSGELTSQDAAVFVTPAHQFPLGYHMSLSRRRSLIEWARTTGNLIVEDDYDGEFRYNVPPSPALASAAHGRDVVAYVGTASKMLSPGLRVAWLIPPRHLVNDVRETLARSQEAVDLVTGAALTHFMESGALIRHLARASRTYSVRRRAFVAAVERYLPQCQILGVDAGLHVCLVLPDGIDASLVVLGLRRSGIALDAIDTYLVEPRRSSTLICNFANLPESKAALIVRSMASVIAEVSGRWPSRRDGFPQRLAAR